MNDLMQILDIMYTSFIAVWPYLVLTIPLSAAVHVSGAAKHINLALRRKPMAAIFLAAAVGAFSPFCSCGIIPVIASLLIGGVPLAPIMSFWAASPSMDPEIFFLSVGMLGWDLAIWRLGATLVLSLAAGFTTHYLVKTGWFGENILKTSSRPAVKKMKDLIIEAWMNAKLWLIENFQSNSNTDKVIMQAAGGVSSENVNPAVFAASCGSCESPAAAPGAAADSCGSGCADSESCCAESKTMDRTFVQKILKETWEASFLVLKFMGLAFLVKALISLYIPDEWILSILGRNNVFSVIAATLIGIPFYTSNLTALPIISGFLEQGMDPGAALAFLIAGPVTTLPAMAAVWGIVNKRVFTIYLLIPLLSAIFFGYLYNFIKFF